MKEPEKVGLSVVIAVVFLAVWFSIRPFTVAKEYDLPSFILAIISLALVIAIFFYQREISDNQTHILKRVSDVLDREKEFKEAQTTQLVREIRQQTIFILEDMEKIEKHAGEWIGESNPRIKDMKKSLIESYHQNILREIEYLQTADFLSSENISQTLKRNLKLLTTSYHTGPAFYEKPDYVDLLLVGRAKSVVITICTLLDDEPNN